MARSQQDPEAECRLQGADTRHGSDMLTVWMMYNQRVMERQEIERGLEHLPVSNLGEIQDDHEIWEYTDGGAHFKVTRHRLPLPDTQPEVVSISVSGNALERQRIIREFSHVLGAPGSQDIELKTPEHMDMAMWLVENQ